MALILNPQALNCVCPSIQQALNNIVGANAPSLRKDKFGALEFLTSDLNTTGFEKIQLDNGNGKYKQVNVNWAQRFCENDAVACNTDCTTGKEQVVHCETVRITNCREIDMNFTESYIRLLCEPMGATQEKWIADTVMNAMNALLTFVNKSVITSLLANKGKFFDGSTLKQIQLWNKHNANADSPRALAIARIIDEFNQQALSGTPAIIGANQINLYYKALGYGCCNDYGADLSQVKGDTAFFYDRFIEGIFGNDHFLAIAPGVSQFITWNANKGEYAKSNDVFAHETLVNPFMPGITFDVNKHYNDCTGVLNLKLRLFWELWTMPTESFSSCDDLYGKNGILDYIVCDEIQDCSTSLSESGEIIIR